MIKLMTEIALAPGGVQFSLSDRILVLGSCFADEIGRKLQQSGFNVCVNPFGTLYNPLSVLSALKRLSQGTPFGAEDCVSMGAGAGKICSFSHHTSFAKGTQEEFLENANAQLESACRFWRSCNRVIITLGTAFVWEHHSAGVVSNCLKRDAKEFRHYRLGLEECRRAIGEIAAIAAAPTASHAASAAAPLAVPAEASAQAPASAAAQRQLLFTVSPIRHLAQGAHENTLSKATLHMALEGMEYFPAYELLNDQLRDYRFYADDLVHPAASAVNVIWEAFVHCHVPKSEWPLLEENQREYRRSLHRPSIAK